MVVCWMVMNWTVGPFGDSCSLSFFWWSLCSVNLTPIPPMYLHPDGGLVSPSCSSL